MKISVETVWFIMALLGVVVGFWILQNNFLLSALVGAIFGFILTTTLKIFGFKFLPSGNYSNTRSTCDDWE